MELTVGMIFFSVAAEMLLAYKIPLWASFAEKSTLFAFLFSLGLSYGLGRAFGANGLIVFISAMGSTVLAVPSYRLVAWYREAKQGGAMAKDIESGIQMAKDLWKLTKFFIKVITFPIWGYRGYKEWTLRQLNKIPQTRSNPTS